MIFPKDYASAPTQIVGAFYYFEEILIKVAVKAFFHVHRRFDLVDMIHAFITQNQREAETN